MAGREDLAPKGSDVTSRDVSLEEINSLFNTTSGHDHDGTDSAKISWNNLLDKPTFNNVFYNLTMPTNEFNTTDDGEGNLSVTWDNQTAGLVLAAPVGSTGTPSFRALVSNDIPALSYEPVLTKGNLTEATSSVLTISGGTGSIIGSGTTIQVKQASSAVSGYLSSTDWNTFNNKSDLHTHPYLSNSITSIQNGYFGNINLYDDSTPSHYLTITNGSNLTATRTLSIITGDADRTLTLSANVTLAHDTHALNADNQTITSGNGMNFTSGNGNVTITLGTPGSITSTSTNSVTSTSHTHAITGFSLDGHTHSYASNAFSTIAVSGQSNVVADTTSDTLTFVAGNNITLTTDANADSLTINSANPSNYGVCSTASATVAKTVTITNFALTTGVKVTIKFDNANIVDNPTLNVNSTGAKALYDGTTNINATLIEAGKIYDFVYDGTNYVLISGSSGGSITTPVSKTITATASQTEFTYTTGDGWTDDLLGLLVFRSGIYMTSVTDYTIDNVNKKITFESACEAGEIITVIFNNSGAVDVAYTPADASNTVKGVVKVGSNINVTDGVISVPNASSTVKGVIELATPEEVLAGTDNTKAVTSDTLNDALDSYAPKNTPIVLKTESYTLALTDNYSLNKCLSASDIIITIPLNSNVAFPIGSELIFVRYGTGEVTFTPAVDVTLYSSDSKRTINMQYEFVTLKKMATDEWILLGSLG